MNVGAIPQTFRILLVEDNAADIYLMRQALKGAELDVELTIIKDGADALAFARRHGTYAAIPVPDLAVLDLNLPKTGGVAVLEAMRQNKDLSGVPVAIISSAAEPHGQTKAKELGVDLYITKPPDLEEFLQIGHVLKEVLLKSKVGQARPGSIVSEGEQP